MKPEDIVAAMLTRSTLGGQPEAEALQRLAELVDAADDCGSQAGVEHAIALIKTFRANCSALGVGHLDYYEANAWHALRRLRTKRGDDVWVWEQPEFEQEAVCLRRALRASDHPEFPPGRQLQILTNLGNLMSVLGRTVESIGYYDRALARYPRFGMALANRGQVFATYSNYDYDTGHRAMFLSQARDDFTAALNQELEGESRKFFEARVAELDVCGFAPGLKRFDLDGFDLGANEKEKHFRRWILNERLFINTLNDLGSYPVAANDFLHLPTMVMERAVGTAFHGFFNQLKQEFAAARWLAYESLHDDASAMADRGLRLLDARDGAVFGIGIEKLKFAFRSSYSLLDKIAVFLNAYLRLGLPPHKVTLRTVWFEDRKGEPRRLNPAIPTRNLPLRGLFWLAKDFSETGSEFVAAMEPDAQDLVRIRNRLEHQFLRVTSMPEQFWSKDLAFNVPEELLQRRTLRLLRCSRAALIYLVLAIHAHENSEGKRDNAKPFISDRLEDLPS
ncbi:hypothetical protein OPIT5_06095 [Opitutaceae bacterium TAV5]|nr:hypothetical protein OPIT5_06095 [Opitutaceae bacterium TAV5]